MTFLEAVVVSLTPENIFLPVPKNHLVVVFKPPLFENSLGKDFETPDHSCLNSVQRPIRWMPSLQKAIKLACVFSSNWGVFGIMWWYLGKLFSRILWFCRFDATGRWQPDLGLFLCPSNCCVVLIVLFRMFHMYPGYYCYVWRIFLRCAGQKFENRCSNLGHV